MTCCCPTRRTDLAGSPVKLSVATVAGIPVQGQPGVAQTFVTEMAGFTVEVAFQRSQGRRDHQEDFVSLCSLDTKSTTQIRHDDMFGPPGKFNVANGHPERDDNFATNHVDPDVQWFGVFDGHGGDLISEHAAGLLHLDFIEKVKDLLPAQKTPERINDICVELFVQFDEKVMQIPDKTVLNERKRMVTKSPKNSGSTATVMSMMKLSEEDAVITIAHAGDSRAILFQVDNPPKDLVVNSQPRTSIIKPRRTFLGMMKLNSTLRWKGTSYETFSSVDLDSGHNMLPLSRKQSRRLRRILRGKFARHASQRHEGEIIYESLDHQPSNRQEAVRIIKNGGNVINNRVNGVLAVSRALGDADQKSQGGLTCTPDTFSVRFTDLFGRPTRRMRKTPIIRPSETMRTKASKPTVNMTEEVNIENVKDEDLLQETKKEDEKDDEEEDPSLNRDVLIVMASDGLWMYYSTEQVKGDVMELLARGFTLQQACQVMMDKVIVDAKGVDNTSILIVRISKTRNTGRSVSIGSFGSFIDVNKLRESATNQVSVTGEMGKDEQT